MIRYVCALLEILCVLSINFSYELSVTKGGKGLFHFPRVKREETPSCEDQLDGKISTKIAVKRSFKFEPWLVYIKSDKENDEMCAGALISPEWIATTGYCFSDNSDKSFIVFNNKRDQYRLIDYFIVHADYNIQNIDNDIALLKIQEPFQIDRDTFSTCIQNPKEKILCKNTCEVGVSSGAPSRVSLMDWESCKRFFENLGHGERLSRNEECLTAPSEHFIPFDYCTGLTGSPLTCHGRDGERVLSGILSLGWTCMHPNSPAIFTKISRYHEWITSVISSNGGTTRNFQCSKPTGNRFVKEVKGRDSDYRLDVFIPRTKGSEERVPRYDHLRDLSEYMQMKDMYGKYSPLSSNYFQMPNPIKPHYVQGEANPDLPLNLTPPPISPELQPPASQLENIPKPLQPVFVPLPPRNLLPAPPAPPPDSGVQPPAPDSGDSNADSYNDFIPKPPEPQPVLLPPPQEPPQPQPPQPQPIQPQPVQLSPREMLPPPPQPQPIQPQPIQLSPREMLPLQPQPVNENQVTLKPVPVNPGGEQPILGEKPQPIIKPDDTGDSDVEDILAVPIIKIKKQTTKKPVIITAPYTNCSDPGMDCVPINQTIRCGEKGEKLCFLSNKANISHEIFRFKGDPVTQRPAPDIIPTNQINGCGEKGEKTCLPSNKTNISHYLFRFKGDSVNQRPAHDIILKANKKLNLNLVKSFKLMVKLDRVK